MSLPVELETIALGDESAIPFKERMLPLVVLLSIFIAGFVIPATSLVEEKEKRTAGAILTTPATLADVYVTKGLIGFLLSMFMGTAILALNQGFGLQPGLTLLILALGGILACCVGLITGSFINDFATMYTVVKMMGIILYGPGIVSLFPKLPQWIGKCFPTYYVMNPIMAITLHNGNWPVIRTDVFILMGIILLMIIATGFIARRTQQMEA